MNWNKHYAYGDKHAYLSPSSYHWINDDKDKMKNRLINIKAKERGTALHSLAEEHITLKIRMPRTTKTLDKFINDAIAYKMTPEVTLFYSEYCFGKADAISFKNDLLRIHDLKTGITPANMKQLEIYAALFCLEYDYKPGDIDIELRIYQNDDIIIEKPPVSIIVPIMDKIVTYDKFLREMEEEWL